MPPSLSKSFPPTFFRNFVKRKCSEVIRKSSFKMGNASWIQTADPKPESLGNPVSKPPAYCGRGVGKPLLAAIGGSLFGSVLGSGRRRAGKYKGLEVEEEE